MLKVQVNKNDMKPDIVHIAYNMFDSDDVDFIDEDKVLVTCYHDGSVEIHENDEIIATYSVEFGDEGQIFSYNQYHNVMSLDDDELYFTLMSDRYFNLEADKFAFANMVEYVEETDDYVRTRYLYVYFKNHHFFDDYEENVTVLFPDETMFDKNDEIIEFELTGEVYGSHCIRFRLDEYESVDCSGITDEDELAGCEYDAENTDRLNTLIRNNVEAARFLALYSGIEDFNGFFAELNGLSMEYDAAEYRFLRYNFMFYDPLETDRLTLGVVRPSTVLKVPLFSKHGTDINQETNVNDRFTKVEIKKAINPIEDMEKDVYVPVYVNDEYELTNVREMRFNLHFRQHRGDDWTVDRDASWNGVNGNVLMHSSFNPEWGFFSYPVSNNPQISDKRDSQSDLLSYLGFTDSDVKYRKNKLKKSFLRLSFYDSMQPTNQNLLAYSTIFIDTGKLYGKYMRNFSYESTSTFGFSRMDVNTGYTKLNLSGSRVNREPYWLDNGETDIDAIESLRLSSQFVVKDKYSSDSSSEGFYLYLWKSLATTDTPSDIYMKVEFNHAGFGRTIPFMLPYKNNHKVKSFSEIVTDWSGDNGGYDVQDYLKFSYIHLKYKYDSKSKKYVYYVDENLYGNLAKKGVMTFNLYEGRAK